jgi:chemotaxis protein histidine kinase CheA
MAAASAMGGSDAVAPPRAALDTPASSSDPPLLDAFREAARRGDAVSFGTLVAEACAP